MEKFNQPNFVKVGENIDNAVVEAAARYGQPITTAGIVVVGSEAVIAGTTVNS